MSTASSDEKLERLSELGLDHGINYASENFVERTRELTERDLADREHSIGQDSKDSTLSATVCCEAERRPSAKGPL
ncbi:MAG: hypothetical protein ABSG95_13740 [Solirubrobacteraceae bacterium]